ncbi:hypothetical protein GIY56_15445 [Paracoccus sp. YIM 132242]|uniref:Peroxidase n=1 Tax=Paracoccus lichenicola TaxID=2665644 RepID=A0A6L6HTZ3_9RHOB|nr:hypothetical protein [Paracoccus lichenicola]MTE01683.1 hypothetical protein [Paracoccus lichenicola]
MPDEPRLDTGDIQGNVIPGFRRRFQTLVYYSAGSEGILRAALSVLAPQLTAAPPVLRHRDARKAALERGEPEPDLPDLWVNIALGAAALDRLDEENVRSLDPGFSVGMQPSRTGDHWKPVEDDGDPNPWHPENWVVGKPSAPLDLLVILAFDDWGATHGDALLLELRNTGVVELHRDQGLRLPRDIEHFGFVDGISEIGVRGEFEVDGVVRPVTTRHGVPPRNGFEYGRPGQPLGWPGQFLVGVETGATTVDKAPPRYRNSSFLVFRRLSQDVRAFDEDTAEVAEELGLPADRFRALVVGRWPSGAALMRHQAEPDKADGILAENYFTFGEDAPDLALSEGLVTGAKADPQPILGVTCPAFAHIRKVNPRDLPTDIGNPGDTLGFQMLRRGIPFGPIYDRTNPDNPENGAERGLLFLAYQRSPSLQFEKLNTAWMNIPSGPTRGGHDLLVGQNVDKKSAIGAYLEKVAELYETPDPSSKKPIAIRRHWVRPSGGAYLFAPSIRLAADLARMPSPAVRFETIAGRLQDIRLPPDFLGVEPGEWMDASLPSGPTRPATPPRHDGETSLRRESGRDEVMEADWPETALLPAAAQALGGSVLEDLDLSGKHFPTETLAAPEAAALAEYPGLRRLKLDGTALRGAALARLVRSLPRLRRLDCAGLDLDDADIATLAEAETRLEEITLGLAPRRDGHRFASTRLTAAVLDSLGRMSGLRALSLRGLPVGDEDVTATAFWSRLAKLDLSETGVSDAGLAHVASLARLDELDAAWTRVGDAGAEALLTRSLAGLDLSHTRLSQGALERTDPSRLERLALAGLRLDDSLSDWLRRAARLRNVDLSFNPVSNGVAAALGSLGGLRCARLAATGLEPGDVAAVLAAPLEELDVSGVALDAADRRAIAEAKGLSRASFGVGSDWSGLEAMTADAFVVGREPQAGDVPETLGSFRLTDPASQAFLDRLGRLKHLETLRLTAAQPGIRLQNGFERLRTFTGMGIGLDDEAAADLAGLPSIAVLEIDGNPFGDGFARNLGPMIDTLELRHTQVGDGAMEAVAALPRLHCIDVPGTRVTPGGVAMLARRASNLQSLALDGRQVDAASVSALAEARRLTELYLCGEEVTSQTIAALMPLRLRELRLEETRVRDDAVPHIAAIRGLRVLTLGNELSEDALAALRSLRPFLDIRFLGDPSNSLGTGR